MYHGLVSRWKKRVPFFQALFKHCWLKRKEWRDEIAKRTFAASCVFLWGGGGGSLGRNKDEPTTANRALKKSGWKQFPPPNYLSEGGDFFFWETGKRRGEAEVRIVFKGRDVSASLTAAAMQIIHL